MGSQKWSKLTDNYVVIKLDIFRYSTTETKVNLPKLMFVVISASSGAENLPRHNEHLDSPHGASTFIILYFEKRWSCDFVILE